MDKGGVDLDGELASFGIGRCQVDGAIVQRTWDHHGVMSDALTALTATRSGLCAGSRRKKPDVRRDKGRADVPLVVLCPNMIGLCGFVDEEVTNHWQFLTVRLDPDGVAVYRHQTVNEHGGRDVDVAQTGLLDEFARLGDLILVELDKECVLVRKVDPELMRSFGQQKVLVKLRSIDTGRVKPSHRCPADQMDVREGVLEAVEVFFGGYHKLPTVDVHRFLGQLFYYLFSVVHVSQQIETVHEWLVCDGVPLGLDGTHGWSCLLA